MKLFKSNPVKVILNRDASEMTKEQSRFKKLWASGFILSSSLILVVGFQNCSATGFSSVSNSKIASQGTASANVSRPTGAIASTPTDSVSHPAAVAAPLVNSTPAVRSVAAVTSGNSGTNVGAATGQMGTLTTATPSTIQNSVSAAQAATVKTQTCNLQDYPGMLCDTNSSTVPVGTVCGWNSKDTETLGDQNTTFICTSDYKNPIKKTNVFIPYDVNAPHAAPEIVSGALDVPSGANGYVAMWVIRNVAEPGDVVYADVTDGNHRSVANQGANMCVSRPLEAPGMYFRSGACGPHGSGFPNLDHSVMIIGAKYYLELTATNRFGSAKKSFPFIYQTHLRGYNLVTNTRDELGQASGAVIGGGSCELYTSGACAGTCGGFAGCESTWKYTGTAGPGTNTPDSSCSSGKFKPGNAPITSFQCLAP